MNLADLRVEIELIDDELIELLARRAAVVRRIWAHKVVLGLAQHDADREAAEVGRLLDRAQARGLSAERVATVLQTIIGHDLLAPPVTSDAPPPEPSRRS